MSYGSSSYGSSSYGGATPTSPLILVSSDPVAGSSGNAPDADLSFVIESSGLIVTDTISVTVNGVPAILLGVFQTGFSGTITGTTQITVTFTTHPLFAGAEVIVSVEATDDDANEGVVGFAFEIEELRVSALKAKTWCLGKRIDLSWTNPAGTEYILVRRSTQAYCRFTDDPGETVYSGVTVASLSDTDLEEGRFYYYTVFISFQATAPRVYAYSSDAIVEGLSIKDYGAVEGDYVYKLLPSTYRTRDADPVRGDDQLVLKRFVSTIQCWVNLWRGYLESTLLLRDPELMPAGRLGESENATSILAAQAVQLGMIPDESYDAGVLRRIAIGVYGVFTLKGTCAGLVALVKLLAKWDATCEEVNDAICGASRVLNFWDGQSYLVTTEDDYTAFDFTPGGFVFPVASADVTVPPYGVAGVLDAMGTFACVSSYTVGVTDVEVVFTDGDAKLRYEVIGTVADEGNPNTYLLDMASIADSDWHWQLEGEIGGAEVGDNAFEGMQVIDSAGVVVNITASTATDSGSTTFVTDAPITAGVVSIAHAFTGSGSYASRVPVFKARWIVGEMSFLYDPLWDARLRNERYESAFSFMPWPGPTAAIYSPSPADMVLRVENAAAGLGSVVTIDSSTTLTTDASTWTNNQWAGYFLLPSWNSGRLFKILANDASAITIKETDGLNLLSQTAEGANFAILSEKNALHYERLRRALPAFTPNEARALLWFTS